MGRKLIDLTGQVFSRWSVISYYGKARSGPHYWNCICSCGNKKIIRGTHLKDGTTQSCGCFKIEKVTTHGHTRKGRASPTYQSWNSMIKRCTNPNTKRYSDWGGRGITVCDRWLHSFENFLADMGECPEGLTLDRIDNDGNYEPSNCKWGTYKEQRYNQRKHKNSVYLTFNGETKLQEYYARDWKINSSMISYHLSQGRSIEWIYENKAKNKGLVND